MEHEEIKEKNKPKRNYYWVDDLPKPNEATDAKNNSIDVIKGTKVSNSIDTSEEKKLLSNLTQSIQSMHRGFIKPKIMLPPQPKRIKYKKVLYAGQEDEKTKEIAFKKTKKVSEEIKQRVMDFSSDKGDNKGWRKAYFKDEYEKLKSKAKSTKLSKKTQKKDNNKEKSIFNQSRFSQRESIEGNYYLIFLCLIYHIIIVDDEDNKLVTPEVKGEEIKQEIKKDIVLNKVKKAKKIKKTVKVNNIDSNESKEIHKVKNEVKNLIHNTIKSEQNNELHINLNDFMDKIDTKTTSITIDKINKLSSVISSEINKVLIKVFANEKDYKNNLRTTQTSQSTQSTQSTQIIKDKLLNISKQPLKSVTSVTSLSNNNTRLKQLKDIKEIPKPTSLPKITKAKPYNTTYINKLVDEILEMSEGKTNKKTYNKENKQNEIQNEQNKYIAKLGEKIKLSKEKLYILLHNKSSTNDNDTNKTTMDKDITLILEDFAKSIIKFKQ